MATSPKAETTTKRNRTPDRMIKYMVTDKSGEFVIEVSAKWRLTFGAVNPGSQVSRHDGLHCLRVWEGEKLRAVYCDVRGFRDLSIPLARKVEQQMGSATWQQDSAGNFSESREVKVESEFVMQPTIAGPMEPRELKFED